MLSFYEVDKGYIEYLQKVETETRGFTHVPNMEYNDREQKFLCGIVLQVNECTYYVPVSSYKQKKPDNILIVLEDDKYNKVKGSLRFNYMFPVPDECVTEKIISNEQNVGRRIFLDRQLRFCIDNESTIKNKARQTYSKVVNKVNESIVNNACDFKLLEEACKKYNKQNNSNSTPEPAPTTDEGLSEDVVTDVVE